MSMGTRLTAWRGTAFVLSRARFPLRTNPPTIEPQFPKGMKDEGWISPWRRRGL